MARGLRVRAAGKVHKGPREFDGLRTMKRAQMFAFKLRPRCETDRMVDRPCWIRGSHRTG